jgi:hypothetical protein
MVGQGVVWSSTLGEMKMDKRVIEKANTSDGGNESIAFSEPFSVRVTLEGASDIVFHRWNPESVEEKARASKNSKAKKTDNVESYVYRDEKGMISIPGAYLHGSIIGAAKFRQDPRSPRKSAADLFKAAIVVTTPLASLGVKDWSYLDKRRVVVQRAGINRTRPAIRAGWKATFDILVLLPEYCDRATLRETIESAGRLIGFAEMRPTYGRFGIVKFE